MKNKKKFIVIGLIASLISIVPLVGANAEWRQDSNQQWWNSEGSSWSVGWRDINNKWYYFGQDGYLLQNTTTPDGFKVDNNGVWIQNITTTNTNSNNIKLTKNVSNTSNSNNNIGNTTLNNAGSITYNDNSKTTNNVDVTVNNTSKEEKKYYNNQNSALKTYYEEQLKEAKEDLTEAQKELNNIESQKTVKVIKQQADGSWQYEGTVDTQAVAKAEKSVKTAQDNVDYYEKQLEQYK